MPTKEVVLAGRVLAGRGWLSRQPEPFRAEVLRRSKLVRFAQGEVIYRFGDPPGGIFGLVDGAVSVSSGPPAAVPQLIHLAVPGTWTGEGCFLTRQARRLELRAMARTTMMHLPLAAMEQMGAQTPEAVRCFAQILMMTVDVLIRVIHDLQKSDAASRIASVLQRAAGDHERPVRLSQAELGAMANASRKQVNAVLRQFSAAGWVSHGYRAIVVLNATALGEFAQQGAFPVAAAPTGDAATGTA